MTDQTPAAPIVHRRRGPSAIWLVPLLAAAVGAWVWVDAIRSRGPIVTIEFESADGLEAGQTHVRYKSVEVGDVHSVDLRPDLTGVIVRVRMHPHTEALLRESSRFWIVRPRIGLEGISGLETLLSGAYIVVDPGPTGAITDRFTALTEPPQTPSDAPGLKLVLTASERGSVDVGSPITHHGVVVGRIERLRLAEPEQGDQLQFDAWIEAQYSKHVRATSRFWNASAFDVRLGAEGLRLRAASLATLLTGGVEFDTPADALPGPPAGAGSSFPLYLDREAARDVPENEQEFVVYFDGSVRGLQVEAPVEFRGLRVGRVRAFELDAVDGQRMLTRVRLTLEPTRLAGAFGGGDIAAGAEALVTTGYRARLASASLLTGAALVELLQDPELPAVFRGRPDEPELPTVASNAQQLADVMESLPRVAANLERLSGSLAELAASPAVQQAAPELVSTLQEARQTLAALQSMVGEQSAFQMRSAEALDQLAAGMRAVRELAEMLERHPEALLKGKEEP
jgi:paraquat-inducible protein B